MPIELDNTDLRKNTLLALSLVSGIGYFSLRRLFEAFNDITQIWDADAHFIRSVLPGKNEAKLDQIVQTLVDEQHQLIDRANQLSASLRANGVYFILDSDPSFPISLRRIPDPPRWLFVEGNLKVLQSVKSVAIVGSREPEENSVRLAKKVTELLVHEGYLIVSGLAEGIDAASHETAIALGGSTIAVLGHGTSHVYPASTSKIRTKISEKSGAVITEYFPKEMYNRHYFLWRNRMQSGLSIAVVPIESTLKGGTARTVRYAIQQHKDIFGVRFSDAADVGKNQVYTLLESLGKPVFDIPGNSKAILDFLTARRH